MNEPVGHDKSPDKSQAAKNVSDNLLPEKSKVKYMAIYDKFMNWRLKKNLTSFSEEVLMAYFNELASTLKPSSMWAIYSMLKSTLRTNHDIDLKKYAELIAFLKKINVGFKSQKSKDFTVDEIERFLTDAPDDKHLANKVGLILGINGACRTEEQCNLTVKDVVEYENSMILVKLPRTKSHLERSFTVTDVFYQIVKKYIALRPANAKTDRFFLNYQKGKCTQQPIGVNKIGGMPKVIATYLGLSQPELYTGHSFRRTSATLLGDAGADLTTVKRRGGWKSQTIVELHTKNSVGNKTRVSDEVDRNINSKDPADSSTSVQSQNFEPLESDGDLNAVPPKIAKVTGSTSNLSMKSSSQINNVTIDERIGVSTNIELPSRNLNLSLNNCSNVTIKFSE